METNRQHCKEKLTKAATVHKDSKLKVNEDKHVVMKMSQKKGDMQNTKCK
jgi:hypothetical protein